MNPEILDVNIILKQLDLINDHHIGKNIKITNDKLSINDKFKLHVFPDYSLLLHNGISYMKLNLIATKMLIKINDGFDINHLLKEFKVDLNNIKYFIMRLFHYGVIIKKNNNFPIQITGDFKEYYPLHCSIEITSKCNLRCKHCYMEANNFNYNQIDINILKKLLLDFKSKVETITFTGGDPLCHPNIKEIISFAKANKFKVRLNTSGYLLDKEFIIFLKKEHIDYVKLSLDGASANTHNYLRNSKLAFDKVIKCMELLNYYDIPYSIGTVVGDFNINEMDGIIKLAKKYNAKKVGIGIIHPLGRAYKNNYDLLISDYYDFLDRIDNILRKYKQFVTFDEDGNWCDFIKKDQFNITSYLSYKRYIGLMSCDGCGAGSKILFIDSSGNLKPCMMSNIILGNILCQDKARENIKKFLKISAPDEQSCLGCKNFFKCVNCIVRSNLYCKNIDECSWYKDNYNLLTNFQKE